MAPAWRPQDSSSLLLPTALVLGLVVADAARSIEVQERGCFTPSSDGRPFLLAYRGASALYPEHSIAAYREAIAQGAHFVECDVVLTADLASVCRHEPNIAQTTDVLAWRRRRRLQHAAAGAGSASGADHGSGGIRGAVEGLGNDAHTDAASEDNDDQGPVLASELTLSEIKELRATWPTVVGAPGAGPVAGLGSKGGSFRAPGGGAATDEGGGAAVCDAGGALGAGDAGDEVAGPEVASLEDLLQMATAVEPAVGVALHMQACAWHNLLPGVVAANTTFEDLLLDLLRAYGYAEGPYGSAAWRRRPLYLMAFEAGSLRYLAQRTSSPLTQVLGPTIPDTGETWASATSSEGLARIAAYASSVAVARQELLAEEQTDAGRAQDEVNASALRRGGGNACNGSRLAASEALWRMREAGLQVFASVFKPDPAHVLPTGGGNWEHELCPLLLGQDQQQHQHQVSAVHDSKALLDGFFTDSPAALAAVFARLQCSSASPAAA